MHAVSIRLTVVMERARHNDLIPQKAVQVPELTNATSFPDAVDTMSPAAWSIDTFHA